jgi:hypothetical protein
LATTQAEVSSQFTQPVRQILIMLIISCLVGAGGYFVFPSVRPVFLANPYLNGVIFGVFGIGVLACFGQVFALFSSIGWLKRFTMGDGSFAGNPPRLLTSLVSLMRVRQSKMQIATAATQSILESVASRIDEAREITRYITNLLIFLGLLGTFWGLATTVPAVVDTIRSLAPSENESAIEVFGKLMTGLEKQLGGMGTAFASSLLGLAGSLVVGLLELFASHGQNRFYRELEEWLSSITRVNLALGDGDASGSADMSGLNSVLDQMGDQMSEALNAVAEQLEKMQTSQNQSDTMRQATNDQFAALGAAINNLAKGSSATPDAGGMTPTDAADQLRALERIATGQEKIVTQLVASSGEGGEDAEARMRLRSIDVQLLRILEEMSAGRQDTVAELRADLARLAKILRQQGRVTIAEDPNARRKKV